MDKKPKKRLRSVDGGRNPAQFWVDYRTAWRRARDPELLEHRRSQPLSPDILNRLQEAAILHPDETDWLVVKKFLLISLKPIDRALFSFRDPSTKKHHPFNQCERSIRVEWERLTGNLLVLSEDKRVPGADPQAYL